MNTRQETNLTIVNGVCLGVLVHLINSHGFHAFVRDRRLYGVMTYSSGPDITEEIQPTIQATLQWLGY